MSVKSPGIVTDVAKAILPCITANSRSQNGATTTSIINVNKLMGDVFSYSDFRVALETILAGAGIDNYSVIRADMRLDSYDKEHYKDYAKLNRYLISVLAVTYAVKNKYRTTDLFSQEQLSIAVKNKYFECENYDKTAESDGKDIATSRLEERSKHWTDNDFKKEFTEKWFRRWDKAVENLESVHMKYNDALERIYKEDKDSSPCRFRSLTDFLIQYQDCIFCKSQMINLLSRFPEVNNPKNRAENHKKRYGIEYFSTKDVEYAVAEIKRATQEFFEK